MRKYKNSFAIFFYLAITIFLVTNSYAQENKKLIGTWVSVVEDGKIKILKITKNKFIRNKGIQFSWNTPFQDNMTLQLIRNNVNRFVSYIVTDANLTLVDGKRGNTIVFRKLSNRRPPSALIDNWTIRNKKGDVRVTIQKNKIILEQGEKIITRELVIENDDKEFPEIFITNDDKKYYFDYFFIDDTHVAIYRYHMLSYFGIGNSDFILIKN